MASIADNSTAMQVMHDANLDFLELIKNFKDFFNGTEPVTFTLASSGGGTVSVTMNSLQKLVSDYRNGVFESITLGDQSTGAQFILTTDTDGQLTITDINGNPAKVVCEKFYGSEIVSSTVGTMTATSCNIESLETPLAVRGGSAELDSLKVNDMEVINLSTPSVDASVVSVRDSLACNEILIYGSRKLQPSNPKNVFYNNNAPIDNAIDGITMESGSYWDMRPTAGHITPSDMGFRTANITGSPVSGCSMPGLVRIWGNNVYSKFKKGIFGSAVAPDNVVTYASIDGSSFTKVVINDGKMFPNLVAWPTGFVSPEDGTYGHLYLSSFLPADFGKEVFYRATWNNWKIYRTMLVTVSNNAITDVSFSDEFEIPKFSCIRFIVNKHDPYEESVTHPVNRQIAYTLERA